jgi:hypothetical protein
MACATGAAQAASPVTTSSPNSQTDEQIRAYWTPERMKAAQPMPMPSVSGMPVPINPSPPPPYGVPGTSKGNTGEATAMPSNPPQDGVSRGQH